MKSISKFHHMCRVVLPRSCQQTCATNLVGRVLHPSIGTVKHACASRRSTTMRGNIPCSGVPPATLSQQRTHDFPGSLGLRLKTFVRVHTEVHSATSVILHPTLPGHRVASTTVRFSWDHIHLHSMSVLPQHIKKARKQVQPKMCVLKCIAPGMANKRDKHTFRQHFPACRQPTTTIPPTFGTQSCVVAASFVSARVALPLRKRHSPPLPWSVRPFLNSVTARIHWILQARVNWPARCFLRQHINTVMYRTLVVQHRHTITCISCDCLHALGQDRYWQTSTEKLSALSVTKLPKRKTTRKNESHNIVQQNNGFGNKCCLRNTIGTFTHNSQHCKMTTRTPPPNVDSHLFNHARPFAVETVCWCHHASPRQVCVNSV